jgi:hypothetical protein
MHVDTKRIFNLAKSEYQANKMKFEAEGISEEEFVASKLREAESPAPQVSQQPAQAPEQTPSEPAPPAT